MGESDVPQINCMFIIGQLIHHAYSSTSGPHALQLFIKSNNVLHHSNLRCMSCSLFFSFPWEIWESHSVYLTSKH